jgi:hypothetical protein
MSKDSDFCLEHSGFAAQIKNLQDTLKIETAKVEIMGDEMQKLKNKIEKKINKIFLATIAVLLALVANLGLSLLRGA